ncbi:MAG: DVUA0089 family protein [Pseudomonadales bacterium]|nr:DVUA0089 family protein [Pseudomonadales bacterium]
MQKVFGLVLLLLVGNAHANLILDESTIVQLGSDSSSVDYTYFSVSTAGMFDISATTTSGNLDTYIRLFEDDGTLDAIDQIAFNDDGGAGLNSLISGIQLDIGDYVLAVGDFLLEMESAITGINIDDDSPETGVAAIAISSNDGFATLSEVPVPTPLALLGLGLAALTLSRRKNA